MIYDVIAMMVFLYLVCIYNTFQMANKEHDGKRPYYKLWIHHFTVNNFIYVTLAIPAVCLVVGLSKLIELFVLYYG